MLRSDNFESAIWADELIKHHILPETSKHTSGLAGWYNQEDAGVADSATGCDARKGPACVRHLARHAREGAWIEGLSRRS
jgi:hypothetical protein